MPPLANWKVCSVTGSVRSSLKRISRPLLRNAISRSRSISVWARNSVSSKTVGSGQNVTIVPVRFDVGLLHDAARAGCRRSRSHLPLAAVAVDLELELARQRVHDRHADAVETAGDLVALAAELAARVQHGEHDLGRRLVLVVGVVVDRDAAPVVVDPAAAVGEQRDVDAGRVAGHRLVDRVVDHLVDEVVQTGQTGRADVHPGALPDGLEALEHRDVFCAVGHSRRTLVGRMHLVGDRLLRGRRGPTSGGPRGVTLGRFRSRVGVRGRGPGGRRRPGRRRREVQVGRAVSGSRKCTTDR